jgi:hypothetical protein
VISVVRREDLAKAVEHAVIATPGVAALHPGFEIEVATYYSGGKVVGLNLVGDTVDIYLTADRVPLREVADDAAAAAARVLAAGGDHRPVNVVIADVTESGLNRRSGSRA